MKTPAHLDPEIVVKGQRRDRFILPKSINPQDKTITAYISTYGWDRMDERFVKGSWRLDNYRKNPVVLWAHDYSTLPIGKNVELIEDEFGLLAKTEFDQQNEFAMQVFSLFERGFLSGFSVGFRPFDYQIEDMVGSEKRGLAWKEAELLEYSAVPVPANPGALVSKDLAEIVQKALGDKILVKSADGWRVREPSESRADFFDSLNGVIDLAKSVKNSEIDDQKLSVIQNALEVFHEIIQEKTAKRVPIESYHQLMKLIGEYGEILKTWEPDVQELVSKVLMQLEAGLRKNGQRK